MTDSDQKDEKDSGREDQKNSGQDSEKDPDQLRRERQYQNFLDFYTDMSDEDPECLAEYLRKEGIDVDELQRNLLEMIEKYKAAHRNE